jgi:hypothetical protein
MVCALRFLVPVCDVYGSTAKPRSACTPATPRRPRAVIGQRLSHAAAHTLPYLSHTAVLTDTLLTLARKERPNRLAPAIKASPPFSSRVNAEPRHGRLCRRRRAPSTACFRRCLNAPNPSSHTPRAYARMSFLGRAACAPEHELQRPPPSSRRQAPRSACSPGQPTLPGPPLGHRKLPVPHVDQPHPGPRQNSSARGRATTAPPPPLAGDTSDPATPPIERG